MSTDSPVLSPMVWLVAMQFMLYAAGWAASSLLVREQRTAVLCWAGFMACIGLGFLLTAQRAEPRTWLAFNGSGVAFVGGLVLLWAGLASYFRRPSLHREQWLTFGVVALVLVPLGADAAQAPVRVLFTYAANAWVTARVLQTLHPAVTGIHGRRVGYLIGSPGVLIILAFLVPFGRQLVNMGQPMELHRFDGANLRSLYIYIAAAAVFNFGFMAMVTHRLLGRLRDMSQRDALTGLYNRRAIEEDLRREWQRWQRGGPAFAVIVLDLDHFKRVNDTHGHAAGDQVLVHTAQRLTAQARGTDAVARTGGEEFLVLMPQADLAGAGQAAERLRQALAAPPHDLGGQPLAVTASLGVAEAQADDADLDTVLRRADAALYEAKRQGRDRVVLAPAN